MSSHKGFKNESQDARRHNQQRAVHPDEKIHRANEKSNHKSMEKNHQKK